MNKLTWLAPLVIGLAVGVGCEEKKDGTSAVDKAKEAAQGAVDATKDAAKGAVDATKDAAKGAVDATKDAAKDAVDTAKEVGKDVADAAKGAADAAKEAGKDVADAAKAAADKAGELGADLMNEIKEALGGEPQAMLDKAMEYIKEKNVEGAEAIMNQFEKFRAKLPAEWQGKIDSLKSAIDTAKKAMGGN
jgi:hypothetical protein